MAINSYVSLPENMWLSNYHVLHWKYLGCHQCDQLETNKGPHLQENCDRSLLGKCGGNAAVVLEMAKCISCIYTRYCYWCEDANAYGENTYVPMIHTYVYSYIYMYIYSIYIYSVYIYILCIYIYCVYIYIVYI